jgi:hypothetical protein
MGEWKYKLHAFLILTLRGGAWSASRLGCFTLGKIVSGTYWIGEGVGPRAGLNAVQKRENLFPLLGIQFRFLVYPACSLVAIPNEELTQIKAKCRKIYREDFDLTAMK